MRRRRTIVTALAVVAALLVNPAWSRSANADAAHTVALPADHTVELPLEYLNHMLVDEADGLVFYAGAGSAGAVGNIAVSQLDGSDMQLIPATDDVNGLTLGPDGKVYGASDTVRGIDVIDPHTLTVSYLSVGPTRCPSSIAFIDAQLWFAYNCGTIAGPTPATTGQGLATLDPVTNAVRSYEISPKRSSYSMLASVPYHPGLLAASDLTGPGELSLIDLSNGTPVIRAHTGSLYEPSLFGPIHFAVTRDGSKLFTGSWTLTGLGSFSTADLTRIPTSYRDSTADDVAISPDGKHIATGVISPLSGPLNTFDSGGVAPIHTYQHGLSSEQNVLDAMAWSGTTLLAVFSSNSSERPFLNVLNTAGQSPSNLTLAAPTTAGRATPLIVRGHLAGAADSSVIITKRDLSGPHTLGTVTTDSNGNFSLPDLPRVGGPNTYVARFLGDMTREPAVTTTVVTVSRGTVPLTLRIDRSTYNFHDVAHLSIHLASHDVKKVQVWIAIPDNGTRYLTTLTVDSKGNATHDYRMAYNTDFIVKFYGDYYYNPRQVAVIGRARALVTASAVDVTAMSGPYVDVCCTATVDGFVTPNRMFGGNVVFELQQLRSGQWVNAPLPSGSTLQPRGDGSTRGSFLSSQPGYFRIRAVFHSDAANVGNVSVWIYVRFAGRG